MAEPAQDLYELGRSALAEHRTADARALLVKAAARCPPDHLELSLRIRISLAWTVYDERGPDAALRSLSEARRTAHRAGLTHLAAAATVQIGTVHARSGDLGAAWRCLREVADDDLPAPDRMRMLLNRGTLASELRHFDDAVADLQSASLLARDLGESAIHFMARHNLGWVQFLRGDLPAALRHMHDAESLHPLLDLSVSRQDRARVLLEAGLADDAHRLLLLARDGQPTAQRRAEVDIDLARCALLLGRADDARERARAAAAVFRRRNQAGWHRRAALVGLLARPRLGAARRLWADAREAGDRGVALRAAAAGLMAPNPGGADRTDLTAYAAQLTRSPTVSLRLAGLLALAAAAEDAAVARRFLRRASSTLVRAQLGLASLDLRTATALHGEAAAALDIELAADLGPDALVETTERWRMATRPSPQVRPPTDPRLAEAASTLRKLRAEFDPAAPDAPTVAASIAGAEHEVRALTWGAPRAQPPLPGIMSAGALRRAARSAGATIVVTVRRGDHIDAVLLGEGPTHTVHLGSAAALIELVEAVHADLTVRARLGPAHPLAATVRSSLNARLHQLGQAVAAPLADRSGPLVIVPTRALTGVPWLALPHLAGRPVTVSPTASSWATGARTVSDPTAEVLTGPALELAAEEARAVSTAWNASAADALPSALAAADLVHVAAHGEHRGDNPLFSSLLLDGGPVFAHELEGLTMRASHVVLSACEVGRATQRPGDQPLGFTATLLCAGVVCVVAPVAPVDDALAAQVMAAYHEKLRTGVDAATALALATAGDPAAGAFTCFGAPWRVAL